MKLRDEFSTLTPDDKIHVLFLLLTSMTLNMRGVACEEELSTEIRLKRSDAYVEISHRILEQIDHYYRRSGFQRPDPILFQMIDEMTERVLIPGLLNAAWHYVANRVSEATFSPAK